MKQDIIEMMVKTGELRPKSPDKERIKSLLKSVENNVNVTKSIPVNEYSATVIFREIYESIRQLGDAKWWLLGYEPQNHQVSMDILKEMNIKDKLRLNHLNRFRKIRNDANYRGFSVSASQAREILDFWERCGKEALQILIREAG
jgi:effector-binding domain-containing protein